MSTYHSFKDSVLLLNACYTPLRFVSYKRAIGLLVQDKVEVVENSDKNISSVSTSYTVPSVIRLRYYVKIPFNSRIALNRKSVLARDLYICQYGCGRKANTIDHVVPRSRGGSHDWLNVLACCAKCNSKKADKLLYELNWKPLKQPHLPDQNIWLLLGLEMRDEWNQYLQLSSA